MNGIGGVGGRRLARLLGPVGAWMWGLHHLPASAEAEAAAELVALGYPVAWLPEVIGSKEAIAHAGILLAGSSSLVVATGIANIHARDPMAMASAARALGEAYPGRFVLGLGVSSERSVTVRGGTYGPPLATMRAYLEAMASAPYAGPQPDPPVPLVLAAVNPRMLELAAERADGAHPFFAPVEHTAFARQVVGSEPCLAVAQPAILTSNPAEARRVARTLAGHYLTMPHHRVNLGRFGYGDDELTGGGSDRLIDALVAWGDVTELVRRVREQLAAGADHVALMVRMEDPADPGLSAFRELAAGLTELLDPPR